MYEENLKTAMHKFRCVPFNFFFLYRKTVLFLLIEKIYFLVTENLTKNIKKFIIINLYFVRPVPLILHHPLFPHEPHLNRTTHQIICSALLNLLSPFRPYILLKSDEKILAWRFYLMVAFEGEGFDWRKDKACDLSISYLRWTN